MTPQWSVPQYVPTPVNLHHSYQPQLTPELLPRGPEQTQLVPLPLNMEEKTWHYLKEKYNFIVVVPRLRFLAQSVPQASGRPQKDLLRTVKLKTPTGHLQNPFSYRFLEAIDAFTVYTRGFFHIDKSQLTKLFELFFFKINSVFPVVHEEEFWELFKKDEVSSVVVYAMVLVTVRDPQAEDIILPCFVDGLNTSYNDNLVLLITQMEQKIRQVLMILPELGDNDKLLRLVCHLLLFFHYNFNKYGNEQSAHDLSDAISFGFSLMIHFKYLHDQLKASGHKAKSDYYRDLWWVLFILDRFNAVMNLKPMFIKQFDFDVARPEDANLCMLVDTSIALENMVVTIYRPKTTHKDSLAVPFDVPAFVAKEKAISENELAFEEVFDIHKGDSYEQPLAHLPAGILREHYATRNTYFISRCINSVIVLAFRALATKMASQATNDNTASVDLDNLEVGANILKMFLLLKDGRGHELVVGVLLVPLIMALCFTVPLISRLRVVSYLNRKKRGIEGAVVSADTISRVERLWEGYLRELELLRPKWWFINEMMYTVLVLNKKMRQTTGGGSKKRKVATSRDRDRININLLLVDDKSASLPPVMRASSPTFYALRLGDVDDDDDEEEEEEDHEGTQTAENEQAFVAESGTGTGASLSGGTGPSTQANSPPTELPLMAGVDDMAFDASKFIDLFTSEFSTVSNAIDFLSEQRYNPDFS